MPPTKVMLIRHGEKQVNGPPVGVTEDGTQDKHSLIVRGWQRAGALIPFFLRPPDPHIVTPTKIYASNVAPAPLIVDGIDISKSLRPQETVTPLAEKLALQITTPYTVGQEATLVADIQHDNGIVLVAWEHKHIPLIAQPLCPSAPGTWPDDRFDVVWVLDFAANGTYTFSEINQSLLTGDV